MVFKKGDRVEKVNSYPNDIYKDGCLATIERDVQPGERLVVINWDIDSKNQSIYRHYLKLVNETTDYVGQEFVVFGNKDYFDSHPCGCGCTETLEDASKAVCIKEDLDTCTYELYKQGGETLTTFFDIKISALEIYINDGVFKLIGEEIPVQNPHCKNNDGRSTCYSCGAPTEDRQGFSSVYQVCTQCGK